MYGIYRIGEFAEKLVLTLFTYYTFALNPKLLLSCELILIKLEREKLKVTKRYLKMRIKRTLKMLQKNGYIKIYGNIDGRFRVELTEKAKNLIKMKSLSENIKNYKKIKNAKRILFFDIPEKMKRKRNIFRSFIKLIGYKEVQKSVFISEYENYEDLVNIAKFIGVEDYIKTGWYIER